MLNNIKNILTTDAWRKSPHPLQKMGDYKQSMTTGVVVDFDENDKIVVLVGENAEAVMPAWQTVNLEKLGIDVVRVEITPDFIRPEIGDEISLGQIIRPTTPHANNDYYRDYTPFLEAHAHSVSGRIGKEGVSHYDGSITQLSWVERKNELGGCGGFSVTPKDPETAEHKAAVDRVIQRNKLYYSRR